jgi:hypothetical protein
MDYVHMCTQGWKISGHFISREVYFLQPQSQTIELTKVRNSRTSKYKLVWILSEVQNHKC